MGNMAAPMRRNVLPVVVVIGATGTGKSKLALEIASRFNGEIISADSMQVYKGLDIITNKVTEEEQTIVPHYLLDYVDPLSKYTVVDFRHKALPIIYDMISRNKMPVIVGGTHYYIESLLWKVLVQQEESNNQDSIPRDAKVRRTRSPSWSEEVTTESVLAQLRDRELVTVSDSDDLYTILKQIDPKMAECLHPNDKRKILRSLQVYATEGRPHSSILEEQRQAEGGNSLGGAMRFKKSCCLWVDCDKTVLNERLDRRVDTMMEKGLVQELQDFHKAYNEKRLNEDEVADYEEGIFQAIGFKEFHQYLILSEAEKATEKGKQLFKEGIESMKLHTRQYAKQQTKWIRNRFLGHADREAPPVYLLDATDLSLWDENVFKLAAQIVEDTIKDRPCKIDPLSRTSSTMNRRKALTCESCGVTCLSEAQWTEHMKSKKHYKNVKRLKEAANQQQNVAETGGEKVHSR